VRITIELKNFNLTLVVMDELQKPCKSLQNQKPCKKKKPCKSPSKASVSEDPSDIILLSFFWCGAVGGKFPELILNQL